MSKVRSTICENEKICGGLFRNYPRQILVVTEDEKQTLMLQPGNRLTAENIVITDKQLSKILGPTAPQREELNHVIQTSYDVDLFCQHLANSLKSAYQNKKHIKEEFI